MRTIRELIKADKREYSPTRSDIVEDLLEHVTILHTDNKRLRETIAAAAKIAAKKVYRQPDKMMLRELLKETE